MPGFHVDPPGPNQIQVHTEIIKGLQPGQDVTYCSYLDYKTPKTFDVIGYKGFQSTPGGHHTVLYTANQQQPPGTHECTEDDMLNVHYIAGGGTDATLPAQELPEGIVFHIVEGKQLMVLNHWINSTDQVIDGQVAFNVTIEDPKPDNLPAEMFADANTKMQVPPGTSVTHTECTMKQDMQMFLIGPHAHEHGTRTVMTKISAGGETTMIQDIPWSKDMVFNTPLMKYTREAPFTFNAGDKFAIDCTYNNMGTSTISFPDEMCIAFGYWFPADREIDCVDGSWPTM